jgi:hypothetical protein
MDTLNRHQIEFEEVAEVLRDLDPPADDLNKWIAEFLGVPFPEENSSHRPVIIATSFDDSEEPPMHAAERE